MKKWSDGYITGNGNKLHFYRTGGEKPPVVINHGAGDDGLCWTRVAKVLEKDYDVILPDARGHGKSTSGKRDYSTTARIADLDALVDTLKLERPVIGGHSLGAETSLHYSATFPDKVRGVFLEDPPIILPGDTLNAGGQTINAKDAGKLMARMMLIFKILPKFIGRRLARKMSPTYPDDEILPWIDSKRRVTFNFLKALPEMGIHQAHPIDVFKKVTAPVLLFIGDREKMAIVTQDAAQEIVQANDKVEVVHLEGASHDIRRTRFDGYLPALQAFLDSAYRS
jgi:pimeloyl-ACP methyl ester carboxylesterase